MHIILTFVNRAQGFDCGKTNTFHRSITISVPHIFARKGCAGPHKSVIQIRSGPLLLHYRTLAQFSMVAQVRGHHWYELNSRTSVVFLALRDPSLRQRHRLLSFFSLAFTFISEDKTHLLARIYSFPSSWWVLVNQHILHLPPVPPHCFRTVKGLILFFKIVVFVFTKSLRWLRWLVSDWFDCSS